MNAMVTTASPSVAATVRQLVAFDLRRFRLWALLLVGLELARAAFAEWTLHRLPAIIGENFGGAFGKTETALLDGVLWLATVMVAGIVVQADLPSDDRAFWRTRPIPPLALAIAKLTTCALLFVALPWVVNAGRLLAYGAPLTSIGASLLQFVVLAGGTVVPTWALALATRTLPRLLTLGLSVFVVGFFSMGAFYYWWGLWSLKVGGAGAGGATGLSVTALLDWQRVEAFGWWGALLITVAALAVLIGHYRHRQVRTSIAAAAVLLAVWWMAPRPDRAPRAAAAYQRLLAGRIAVTSIGLLPKGVIDSHRRYSVPYPVPLTFTLKLPPLPTNVSASVFLRQVQVHGRRPVAARDAWQCCFNGGIAGILAPSLAEASHEGIYPSTSQGFEVDLDDLEALRDRTVAVSAKGEVRLIEHRLAGIVSLGPGATARVAGRLIEVLAWQRSRSTLLVRYAEFPSVSGPPYSDIAFYVGRRSHNRVSATNAGWGSSVNLMMAGPQPTSVGRQWVERHHVVVQNPDVVDPQAQLYIVESRDLGTVRTPVSQGGLEVWAPRESARTP